MVRPSAASPSLQKATEAAAELAHRRGKAKAYRFAQLWIKHQFNDKAAYAEFVQGLKRAQPIGKNWAHAYAQSPIVRHYAREILQEATQEIKDNARDDVSEMLALNRTLIWGDICDLLEQTRQEIIHVGKDGSQHTTYQTKTVLKPLQALSRRERLLIQEIRFKDGQVTGIKAYSRLDAERQQLLLLELIHRRGGSDQDWMGDFKQRITRARNRRIEEEIKNGKVIRLAPPQQAGGADGGL